MRAAATDCEADRIVRRRGVWVVLFSSGETVLALFLVLDGVVADREVGFGGEVVVVPFELAFFDDGVLLLYAVISDGESIGSS